MIISSSIFLSCQNGDDRVLASTITSFTPTSGLVGTTVISTGTNFSTTEIMQLAVVIMIMPWLIILGLSKVYKSLELQVLLSASLLQLPGWQNELQESQTQLQC